MMDDFSALIGTLSLHPDGLLSYESEEKLDPLSDDVLSALVSYVEDKRKVLTLAEIFAPSIDRAAMVHALSLLYARRRARRRMKAAAKSARWRMNNGALAPVVSMPEDAIVKRDLEKVRTFSKRERDAFRKRKAYHAALGPEGVRLAPIEHRRLLNAIRRELAALSYDELMIVNSAIGEALLEIDDARFEDEQAAAKQPRRAIGAELIAA